MNFADAPAPESLATRVMMLSRTPGAKLTVVEPDSIIVSADSAEEMGRALDRVTIAATKFLKCDYSWIRHDLGYGFDVKLTSR